jgi:hypothetical protein
MYYMWEVRDGIVWFPEERKKRKKTDRAKESKTLRHLNWQIW